MKETCNAMENAVEKYGNATENVVEKDDIFVNLVCTEEVSYDIIEIFRQRH